MTIKKIRSELEKIYKEMESWHSINAKLNYIIPKEEVNKRELFLICREVLYKLEAAKKSKNKLSEDAHEATFDLIKTTLELY